MIFIDNLLRFMISLLAFSMDIKDLEQQEMIKYSSDFLIVYFLLEKFGTSCFHFKIMNFLGEKLFSDDKYVFSSCHGSHHFLEE